MRRGETGGGLLMQRGIGVGSTRAAIALNEHKEKCLAAMQKLNDLDTQRAGVDSLLALIKQTEPAHLNVLLSCLYDSHRLTRNSARKEAVRLFGYVAAVHSERFLPHVPKVVGNILRRFKDPESSVLEACAETLGVIAQQTASLHCIGADEYADNESMCAYIHQVFAQPLVELLSEKTRAQSGAAAASLSKVLMHAGTVDANLAKLVPKMLQCINNATYEGKAPVIDCVTALLEVGSRSLLPQLPAIMGVQLRKGSNQPITSGVLHALTSADWNTRKAAVAALVVAGEQIGVDMPDLVRHFVLKGLETVRFDKVKPVREAAQDCLQVHKTVNSHKPISLPKDPEPSGLPDSPAEKTKPFLKRAQTAVPAPRAIDLQRAQSARVRSRDKSLNWAVVTPSQTATTTTASSQLSHYSQDGTSDFDENDSVVCLPLPRPRTAPLQCVRRTVLGARRPRENGEVSAPAVRRDPRQARLPSSGNASSEEDYVVGESALAKRQNKVHAQQQDSDNNESEESKSYCDEDDSLDGRNCASASVPPTSARSAGELTRVRYSRSEDSSEDPNDKDVMSADDPPAHPDYDKLRAAGEVDGKTPERDSSRPTPAWAVWDPNPSEPGAEHSHQMGVLVQRLEMMEMQHRHMADMMKEFTETVNHSLTALTSRVVELEHNLFTVQHVPASGGPDQVFPSQSGGNVALFPSSGQAAGNPVSPDILEGSTEAAPQPRSYKSEVDREFTEVLMRGDEVNMINLLKSKGPVATELSAPTLSALMRMLLTLLKNRTYMDVGLQWFEQYPDISACLAGIQRVLGVQILAMVRKLTTSALASVVGTKATALLTPMENHWGHRTTR